MEARKILSSGQFLTFSMNHQTYGMPIQSVREINRVSEITPLPQTPDYVAGVMNLRGKVIPVINLRKRLGLLAIDDTKTTCIIVVDGLHGKVGVIVDAVNTVLEFPDGQIENTPQLNGGGGDYVLGMGKVDKLIVILIDIVGIVSDDSAIQLAGNPSDAPAA